MKRLLSRGLDWLDDCLTAASLARRRERPALIGLLFHAVFESEQEIATDRVWPSQPLRVDELARAIEYFLAHDYRFVTPAEIAGGLDPAGYYALLTFDDGYANNQRALPVLRALNTPATFFVSARHVAQRTAFWWDVVFRERRRRGTAFPVIRREVQALKRHPPEHVDAYLRRQFGPQALAPLTDTDRPFTAAELRRFAEDPLVTLGNHTASHADLTQLPAERVAAEIGECQTYLTGLTGRTPTTLAYPNGRYDRRCIAAARAAGLQLAVTVGRGKTRLPLAAADAMRIDRTFIPCGAGLLSGCARARSDVQMRRWIDARAPWQREP